jgi:hypothetical protein
MKKFKLKIHLIIATCSVFLLCTSAQAFVVQYSDPGPNTNAIAIWNLDIGGTAYDITFVESDADTAELCPGASGGSGGVPGTTPCDLYSYSPADSVGDTTGADAAAAQIQLALNEDVSIGGSGIPTVTTVGDGQAQVLVAWQWDDKDCDGGLGGNATGTCASNVFNVAAAAGAWLPFGTAEIPSSSTVDFARFSLPATVVPIPPAAWLFGSALGMLGWIRRRAHRTPVSGAEKGSPMG